MWDFGGEYMPKVSVIIPAYNAEKDINKSIDSVVAQEMQDFEIVVVNDGSTDNTESVVLSYKSTLKDKLRYYYKENSGVADTRNFGIDKATGEYILFVDADDYIDKDLLVNLQGYMEKHIDVIKYKLTKIDIQGNVIEKIQGPVFDVVNGEQAFNELFYQDVLIDAMCVYLWRREYITLHNYRFVKGTYHEDFGLIPIMIVNADTVVSTDVYGYYYVQSENSIMRNADHSKTIKKMQDSFMYYDKMLETMEKANIANFTKENIKLYYTNSILLKISGLSKEDKKQFIQEFKNRNMARNIKIRNPKQFVKRLILTISVNQYLKTR